MLLNSSKTHRIAKLNYSVLLNELKKQPIGSMGFIANQVSI